MNRAKQLIQQLELEPLLEGGYFKRIFESELVIPKAQFPDRFSRERLAGSAIYYLLESGDFSAFHRLRADEQWHFYEGAPLVLHLLDHKLDHQMITLGNPEKPRFETVVPHGTWMAARSLGDFSLVGCTCTPAFHADDFELGERNALIKEFPEHEDLVRQFTRG